MKKLITANDIREAHARGEQAMSVVLRASIITPEAREVADLLGFTITECDESIPVTASVPAMLLPSSPVTRSVKPTQCGSAPSKRPNLTLLPSITLMPPLPVTDLKLGCIAPCSSDCFSFITFSISCATRLSVNWPSGSWAMMVSRMRWLD